MSTRTETRDGGVVWTIETSDDGRTRKESCEYVQQLANMSGGPPRMAVRTSYSADYYDGRRRGASFADVGRPYMIRLGPDVAASPEPCYACRGPCYAGPGDAVASCGYCEAPQYAVCDACKRRHPPGACSARPARARARRPGK